MVTQSAAAGPGRRQRPGAVVECAAVDFLGIVMALKATVYRVQLEVADIDRGYYADHPLTLARHPSETEQRLMVRLLAFALWADEALAFGRGLSTDDEPDLWLRDPTGEIVHWIDVGLPDERRLRRAAGRARQVSVLAYGQRAFDVWWDKHATALARLPALRVLALTDDAVGALAAMASRNLTVQCTVQEGQVAVSTPDAYLVVEPIRVHPAG
jgi:uncharacterized protein YaeQ